MLTSFIPITFFNEYIITPKTWLHYFKNYKKSFIIILYLSCFYYFNTTYIVFIIVVSSITIINLPIPIKQSILTLNNSFITFFFINILLYMNYKNKYSISNIYQQKNLKTVVPEFFTRSILIPITYSLWLKILFLTTKYEFMILSILYFIQKNKNFYFKKIGFIIALSSQLILLISQKISFLYITVIMRDRNFILQFNQNNILSSFYINLVNFSYFQIVRISYMIQLKKINYVNFSIIDL
nr:hypothetical protein [Hypnea brasiliensis]